MIRRHWVLDEQPWPKTVEFCDLLGTVYAPVSKIPSVKRWDDLYHTVIVLLNNKYTKNICSEYDTVAYDALESKE